MTVTRFLTKGLVLLMLVTLSVGCAKKQTVKGAHARAEKGTEQPMGGSGETGLPVRGDMTPINIMDLPGAREAGLCPMIYFDYDKADVKGEFTECLNNIAAYFQQHPEYDLLIEGHCDERGTDEYNMALGERRANSTASYVTERGLSAGRTNLRSMGESQPLATCHDESCWSQNRRAQFYGIPKGEGR